MKIGFRLRIVLVSLALTFIAFLGADAFLAPAFERLFIARIGEDAAALTDVAALAADACPASLDDTAAWDALAHRLAEKARLRVVIVRVDGVLLGDSDGDRAALGRAWSERPPAEGDVRSRATFRHDGREAGSVLVTLPEASLEPVRDRIEWLVGGISVGVGLAATLLWVGAAHWLARLLRRLTATARQHGANVGGGDELAEVGDALDRLAESLSAAIGELRDERDLQSAILDAMQEGVLVLDDGGRVVRQNPAIRAMLLLPGDAAGRPLVEFVQSPELDAIVTRARGRGEGVASPPHAEIELAGLRPRRLFVSAAALEGRASAVLLVFRDVTEVRRLETMRRDFVANVSHELRTPVAAIRSAAETLHGAATRRPESAGRFVEMVARNAERLQRLFDELLDLSRVESSEFRVEEEPVEVAPLVAQVVGQLRARAEERGVRVSVDVPASLVIRSDRRALEQVLSNLLENAVKYCPGAPVRVAIAAREDAVELRVEDEGPGIEAHHLPRLFERFYRADAARSREIGGSGLGLSIVKHLVEAMHGSVAVESAVGRGTTFVVTLPAARVHDAA